MSQSSTNKRAMNYLTVVIDIAMLSSAFTIFSIPLLTMGGSFTALHYAVMQKIERKSEEPVWKIFMDEFRNKLREATSIWAILLVVFFALEEAIRYGLYADWFNSGTLGGLAMISCIVLLCLTVMVCMYAFPLLAKFNTKKKALIKNALLLSVKNFFVTVILMFCMAVIALLFYFKTLQACMFFSMLGFGGYAYLHNFLMLKCFSPYLEPLFDEEKAEDNEFVEKIGENNIAVGDDEKIQAAKEDKSQEDKIDNKTDDTLQEGAIDSVSTLQDEIELEDLPIKKTIRLSDAAEDEKVRKIEKEKAIEKEKRAAVEKADKEARAKAKELADKVKDNISYETTGDNVYRRANHDEMNKNNARGNNKKRQRKK